MNPWISKAVVLAGVLVMIAIRAPHGQRSRSIKVLTRHKGGLETALLTVAMISFAVPLLWVATTWFAFADFELRLIPLACGAGIMALGLWLFYRSHADLGTNWSITLEVRENHQLVTRGVYRRIRHPMYAALLLFSVGLVLVLPNWIAGPSYLVAMTLLVAFRLGPEERMMREQFGDDYRAYAAGSKRLVPGIW